MAYEHESLAALTERLRRLEAAVDATQLGLWEWDVPSGELTWNARNRELFGVPPDRSLKVRDYPGLVHPDDRESLRVAYEVAAQDPDGGSFSLEYRTLFEPNGRTRWVLTRGRVLRDGAGARFVVGSTLDITDRKTAEERRDLVLRELAHRAKNGILVMMALVTQSARNAVDVKDLEEVLTARLGALAASQDLVTDAAGGSALLGDIVQQALTPFDPHRFDVPAELRGIRTPPEVVVGLALLLHELSTNAVKYGALSQPAGRVRLELASCEAGQTVLAWTEMGGPPVVLGDRRGFGSRLLDVALRASGGLVEAEFPPEGFRARIHFPGERAALQP